MLKNKRSLALNSVLVTMACIICLGTLNVFAVTNQFRGVNWADSRDNFQRDVIYISGLSSTDTYASASIVADRIISQFISKLGSNGVRMPINEATVSKYWATYTGAIDMALTKGRVLICFWSNASGTKPTDINAFWTMWKTVTDKYGKNSNCYFEIFNEPSGYNKTDLCNLYDNWLKKYPDVPKNRVVLDGSGLAMNVPDVASDSRFSGCYFAVHEYSFFGSSSMTTEAQWISHFKGFVGKYSDQTICTEWGGPMSPGSKNGVSYGYLDYSKSPTNYFEAYIRGISSQLKSWNMGSFLWPGLRDGDWYSMTTKSGSGSSITLSVCNQSGLDRLHYSWTDTVPSSVFSSDKKSTVQSSAFKVNCSKSALRIEFTVPQGGHTSLELLNLNGKAIKKISFQTAAGRNYSPAFDLADIQDGSYIVKLENGGNLINSSKVVLTK